MYTDPLTGNYFISFPTAAAARLRVVQFKLEIASDFFRSFKSPPEKKQATNASS